MLELRIQPTEKVIASYYNDLLEYQKTTSASRGSLGVVVGYLEASKQLDFTCRSLERLYSPCSKPRNGHMHISSCHAIHE